MVVGVGFKRVWHPSFKSWCELMIPDFHGKKVTKIPELNIEEYSGLTELKISLSINISLNNLLKRILNPLVGFNSYNETMEIMKASRLP
jgi:hypothetical protein